MKVTHNPPTAWRNWWQEIEAWTKIQPISDRSIQSEYFVGENGVIYLDKGRTAFSQPQHKHDTLVSDRFWFCLGFAGQSKQGNYLGHIFPGENTSPDRQIMTDHGIENILRHRANILNILTGWRDDGLRADEVGLFGWRIWKEKGGDGYLRWIQLLAALGREVFGEEPKIIWLPVRGHVSALPRWVAHSDVGPQTVFVWDEGVIIHTDGEILETPLAISDMPMRISQILG